MTPKSYKKNKAVIEDWAEGKTIEFKSTSTNAWYTADPNELNWNEHIEYRVVPQETYTWQNIYEKGLW